jgi:protein-histidine pros-kinase
MAAKGMSMHALAHACGAWLERMLPGSLFARLALLLIATAIASHVLALTLLFESFPFGRPPPPPATYSSVAPSPPPHPHGPRPAGILLDIGVRLGAVLLAAWVGARWLTSPVHRLARGAASLGENMHQAPLPEEGSTECRAASRVINQMQRNIQSQMAQRDRFLAAVSHDLRTPLTRLALRAEYLEDAPTRQRFAKDITEMNDMIRSTLDYLRGTAEAEKSVPVDMPALVQSLVHDLQDTGLDVTLGSVPDAAELLAQPGSLRRCLGNLIENAVRYGQRAHVSLELGLRELHITVDDEGEGLAPSDLNRVTEPFYRVEASRNRNSGGVGLGLSIAQEIVGRHGGTLQLSNRKGGGLRALVSLPRQA